MNITTGTTFFGHDGTAYAVVEYLASGGCGVVYKVQDKRGNSKALKTILAPTVDSIELDSLLNEGKQAVKIRHPHVIAYDFLHDGTEYPELPAYILMEYASGGTLYDAIAAAAADQKFFPEEELESMFLAMVGGMKAIGEVLIHRDLKPGNILIADGVLKITDFGFAKVVREATRLKTFKGGGTYPYMAPEVWKNDTHTLQVDIYALGIIFYELAALRHPFEVKSHDPQEWRDAHLTAPVPFPRRFNNRLSTRLEQIILKMLEKRTSNRPKDWAEVESLFGTISPASEVADSPLIQRMVREKLAADEKKLQASLEAEKKGNERREFEALVDSQVNNDIIEPLRSFFTKFNTQYAKQGFSISGRAANGHAAYRATTPSGAAIEIEIVSVHPDDCWRIEEYDDYGERRQRRVQIVPKVLERPVRGWGFIKGADGRGLNLLLVKNSDEGEIYGDWFVLRNKPSFMYRHQRPLKEPFAFDLTQLPENVEMLGVSLYRYEMRLEGFAPQVLEDFLATYVA